MKISIITKIKNFSIACIRRFSTGMKNVSETEYIERITTCNNCDYRKDDECLKCGCIISKKAWWASEDCPENKWPKLK